MREIAFNEFYRRYSSFLLKVCQKCCSGFDTSEDLARDIHQNTFLKILSSSKSFKPKEGSNSTNISRDIKAWLARIAKNELINFLRKNPDEIVLSNPFRPKSDDGFLELISLQTEEEIEGTTRNESSKIEWTKLDKALKSLTERENHILMTYMQYFNSNDPQKHLPDDILESLCKKFSISSENVRKIKSRALVKIKNSVENK